MRAVIMAGGSGKRLRPMTSTVPKPMIRLFSKPVLSYTLDLLEENGFDEVTLTLGYMAERIEDYVFNEFKGKMRITVLKEDEPLGTAGSVKKAAKSFTNPFLVISGDCLCDFNLKSIMEYHLSEKADITIACTKVDDPREYGVVDSDDYGKVKAFTEKPQWQGVVSDCVNTGIYVINPQIINYIPDTGLFDFSKDLFPILMKENKKLRRYVAEGYWCDIGSPTAYKQCCKDVMDGKTSLKLPELAQGVFVRGNLPKGNYSLVSPCYVGKNVIIADGAVVGPYSCIDDGCLVGRGSKIRNSFLLPLCEAHAGVVINGAVLCEKSVVKSGARIYEDSVVGASCVVEQNAVIGGGASVWPEKRIERGANVLADLKYGEAAAVMFSDYGISGCCGVELDAVTASVIGQAVASSSVGDKVGIATDGGVLSKAAAYSVTGALIAHGSHVRSFGDSFYSQLKFFVLFCGLKTGIFISQRDSLLQIDICGEGGLPVENSVQREIENRVKYREFSRCSPSVCRDVSDMTGMGLMYRRELIRQSEAELSEVSCLVKCDNEKISLLMEDCFYRLGCRQGDEITFKISSDGLSAAAFHRDCGWLSYDKLLGICINYETENGRDVAARLNAPRVFDEIAARNGRRILRYRSYEHAQEDGEARKLSFSQLFMTDALFTAVKILGIIAETGKNLARLYRDLPPFFVSRKKIKLDFSPSKLTEKCEGEKYEKTGEGLLLEFPSGFVLLTPSRTGKTLQMISEAASYEMSKDLCAKAEDLLKGKDGKQKLIP